jgi:ABC-type ATPase with predicted acetyltransferase domain
MIICDNTEILMERDPDPKAVFSLLDEMWIEKGNKEDWAELHGLHYKAEGLPPGSRYWRVVTNDGYLVGIVMTSAVALLSAPRHLVFPKLSPGNDTRLTNVHRAKWLNNNIRRAARIVTDTMYRGVGISYRMTNLASRLEGFRFVEIQSSMSKFNPFDAKAGVNHANLRPATAYKSGLAFLRRYFKSHPADHENVLKELRELSNPVQKGVVEAMREFYYKNSAKERTGSNMKVGTRKVDNMTVPDLLRELQQLIFATPIYGIYENPDYKTKMPDRLPLRAFDWQGVNEPLRLDKL